MEAQAPKLKFELDLNQLNVVLAALGKIPLEDGVGVFMYLRTAAESQLAAQQPPAEADGAGE